MRKSKLGCILAYSAVFCGVGVLAANAAVDSLLATSEESTFGHWLAVSATKDTYGCNEYWIECGSNIVRLTKPDSGTIIERGTPSDSQISEFGNDGRKVDFNSAKIRFGEYPQTPAGDEIAEKLGDIVINSDGYYHYGGERYKKASDNNFYKVEPIVWDILDGSNPSRTLMQTERIVDAVVFDSSSNSYEDSVVEKWITNIFPSKAFNSMDLLSNDSETETKTFLLSDSQYINSDLGFSTSKSTSKTRCCIPTQFAEANGVYKYNGFSVEYKGYGCYWTRSTSTVSNNPIYVNCDGSVLDDIPCWHGDLGVRPAIWFNAAN